MDNQWSLNIDSSFVSTNFINGLYGIDNNKGIMISCKFVECVKEVSLLKLFLGHVVKLDTANNCCLFNIGINIMQTLLDSLLKILSDAVKSERTQAYESKTSYFVVLLLNVHPKSIDSEDGKLLVLLSIVDEIQIYHLFHDDILCARGFDHLRVKSRNIDSQSHVSNDLFDDIPLFIDILLNSNCSQQSITCK